VQVTHAVAERLRGAFEVELRGLIEVKGKGPTPTYFLVKRSEGAERFDGPSRAALA
jgi:hypothetical protein